MFIFIVYYCNDIWVDIFYHYTSCLTRITYWIQTHFATICIQYLLILIIVYGFWRHKYYRTCIDAQKIKKGKTEKWANRVTREGYIREERLCRLFCHSAISFVHRYEMVGVFLSLSRKTVRDHYVYDVYEISIWDLKTIRT